MDNLTHSLVGLAAAKAGLERVSPYATIVCIAAANAPDADIVTLVDGGLVYLKHHRGITHSIVGTLALGILLPLIFYGGERLLARVRGREPRARLGGLLLASLVVTATHPLLDWTNSYGLRPFLPWSGRWYFGDIVFVLDPWLWLLLGGACFLLTSKSTWRTAFWSVLALVVAAVILFLPQRPGFEIPTALKIVWLVCLAGVALAHRARLGARLGERIAVAALVAVVVYWGALAVVQARAQRLAESFADSFAAQDGSQVLKAAAMPVPMNPAKWLCIAETGRATYKYELGPRASSLEDVTTLSRHEKPTDVEAMRAAASDERAAILLDFTRFPVWQLRTEADGRKFVRITDVRFGEPPPIEERGNGNFSIEIAVQTP